MVNNHAARSQTVVFASCPMTISDRTARSGIRLAQSGHVRDFLLIPTLEGASDIDTGARHW